VTAVTDDEQLTRPDEADLPVPDGPPGPLGTSETEDARRRSASRRRGAPAPARRRSAVVSPSRRTASGTRARSPREAGVARPRTSRQTRTIRLAVALGVLAVIIGLIGYFAWSTLYAADAPGISAGQPVTIMIAKGTSGEQVASQLSHAGVVANATMFRIQAQLLGATNDIKAGTYVLTTGSAYETVIRRLQQGPPEDPTVTFTIPEGWGIDKIAARIQDKLGIPAAEFISLATTGAAQFHSSFLADDKTKSLEGYLFPKTYTVKEGTTATGVITVMLAQYGEETAMLDYSYAESKGLTPHDVLTLASIIEREASVATDRPNVASVIYNRLAINMRLQLDSTVQYALDGKATLTLQDLQTSSPYNTYMHSGLPPGPICNPGIVAIKAALAPAKTKYLYYILMYKDGRQSFATNYADFLKLKAQFKKGLK
jgi:UPF0755 protein